LIIYVLFDARISCSFVKFVVVAVAALLVVVLFDARMSCSFVIFVVVAVAALLVVVLTVLTVTVLLL
jgi:hypothetical protein